MNPVEDQKRAYTPLIARMCMKSFSVSFKSGRNDPLKARKILIWMILSSSSSSPVDLQTHFYYFGKLNEEFDIAEGYHCVMMEENAIKYVFHNSCCAKMISKGDVGRLSFYRQTALCISP